MAQGYTLAQMKAMGATPVADTPTAPASSGGLTLQQMQSMGATVPQTPSLGSRIATDVKTAGATAQSAIAGDGQFAGQNTVTGTVARGTAAAAAVANAVPQIANEFLPQFARDALGGVGKAIGAGVDFAGNISSTLDNLATKMHLMTPEQRDAYSKASTDLANSPSGQVINNIANTLNSTGQISNDILAAKGTATGVQKVVNTTKSVVGSTADMASAMGNAVETKVKGAVYKELPGLNPDQTAARTQIAKDWAAPAEANKPGFRNAQKILAKSPDTTTFLADRGISPYTHVEDGAYNTLDTADSLREQAGTLSRDLLRPSLQAADYGIPKVPVQDILKKAISDVKSNKTITPGNEAAIISHLTDEANALSARYPDGMNLTEMHDNKITYSQNAGYSPVNDPKVNNSAIGNRTMSSVLQNFVESKAPPELNVGAFNKALSKYYKGADYLASLNGKKAPVSMGQQISRGIAKFGGATIGAHFGGGVVSEFAGYQIGKAIEQSLENLTLPMRAHFLDNLSKTNPESFKAVQDYLNMKANGGTTPLLNAGTPPVPGSTPIPMGGKNAQLQNIDASGNVIPTESSVSSVPAQKASIPGVNPVTKRMMRVYKSTP